MISYLLDYSAIIKVESFKINLITNEMLHLVTYDDEADLRGYVTKSCNHKPSYFIEEKINAFEKSGGSQSGTGGYFCWPPQVVFERDMQKKLLSLSQTRSIKKRHEPFRGNMGAGLDARKTLKSYLKGSPTLIVELTHNRKRELEKDSSIEPEVWIFSMNPSNGTTSYFLNSVIFEDDSEVIKIASYLGSIYVLERSSDDSHSYGEYLGKNIYSTDNLEVLQGDALGIIRFNTLEESLEEAKKKFKSNLQLRLPHKHDFEYNPSAFGSMHFDLLERFQNGVPWWEIAILLAFKYSEKGIRCVVPKGFSLPAHIKNSSYAKGKRVDLIPLSKFSNDEISKLNHNYSLHTTVKYKKDFEENFTPVMRRYWYD